MRCRNPAFALLFILCQTATLLAADVRYDDILYLDEIKQSALHLKALHRAPIASTRDPSSVLAYIAEGQAVEIIGLGETQDYVVARIATGSARGWVEAQALEAPPTELLTKLHERSEKEQAYRELIERHEVAVGMTQGEVRASLGKPASVSHRRAKEGDEEQWSYVVYKYLPHYVQSSDTHGEMRQVVTYRRELAGHKVITFHKDEATKIAEVSDGKSPQPSVTAAPATPTSN